jgi:hypothetical protein
MFTRKINFLRPDGSEGKSPSNGTALWATGYQGEQALLRAEKEGLGILADAVRSNRFVEREAA